MIGFGALVLRLPAGLDDASAWWSDSAGGKYADQADVDWAAGLGGELGLFPADPGSALLRLSVDAHQRHWPFDHPVDMWVFSLPVDLGYRFDSCNMGSPAPVCFWFDATVGPRLDWLSIAGWDDQLAIAWGTATGIGLSLGKGDVRGQVGLHMGMDWSGGSASGQGSFGDGDVGWSWESGGFVAAGQAGVEFR